MGSTIRRQRVSCGDAPGGRTTLPPGSPSAISTSGPGLLRELFQPGEQLLLDEAVDGVDRVLGPLAVHLRQVFPPGQGVPLLAGGDDPVAQALVQAPQGIDKLLDIAAHGGYPYPWKRERRCPAAGAHGQSYGVSTAVQGTVREPE